MGEDVGKHKDRESKEGVGGFVDEGEGEGVGVGKDGARM